MPHVQGQTNSFAALRIGLQPEQLSAADGLAETDATLTFQLAEVAVTRNLFAAILARIARLAIPPPAVGLIRV